MSSIKHSAESLRQMKSATPIPMLTAYTTPVARCLEQAGIPVILVGDTVGMVEMGFDSTRHVTLEHMQYHIGAVRRGATHTHIIGDLPYDSDRDPDTALRSARALVDAGADSVKLEGPKYNVIRHLIANGIEVVGHTGLTPQTSHDFKQVGRLPEDAMRIAEEARGIAESGAFMIVLEHIPASLAGTITQSLTIPTIGIGAGPSCDGQVLVINDVIGLGDKWPPFSRQYAYASRAIIEVAKSFIREVEDGRTSDTRTLHLGKHLELLVTDGGWEYVQRAGSNEGVAILAVTDPPAPRIVLVEQQRPPFGKPVIELPAGLVGDNGDETLETAVKRELREEAGFDCRDVILLCEGSTSPGLTNETSSLCQAVDLSRIDSTDHDLHHADGSITHSATRGLASEGESIVVHEVLLDSVIPWLKRKQEEGKVIDLRIYAGLAFAPGNL